MQSMNRMLDGLSDGVVAVSGTRKVSLAGDGKCASLMTLDKPGLW